VNEGYTGTKQAAACTGPCGAPLSVPVDAVVLLDRTGSMDSSGSVDNLRSGALSVLSVMNPSVQRIALGFTGPSSLYNTVDPNNGSNASSLPTNTCTSPFVVHALAANPGNTTPGTVPTFQSASAPATANAAAGATTLVLNKPTGTATGDLMLAAIVLDGGSNTTISAAPAGWTRVRAQDNSTTNVGVVTYWKFAAAGDAPTTQYTWTFNSARAAGGILRYSGVNATPINVSGGGNGTVNPITAPSVNTTAANTAIVRVFGDDANATFTAPGVTEQFDLTNTNAAGPSIMVATGSQVPSAATGTVAATATVSNKWAAETIALAGTAGPVDGYDTSTATGVPQWIPIGFTGTDAAAGKAYTEAYVDNAGVPNPNTHIVESIGCFDVSGTGTNLATPLRMALAYLTTNGRPNAVQGIILETDGTPAGNEDPSDQTCAATSAAAAAVKAANGGKIQLFTIGYGLGNAKCPDNGAKTAIQELAEVATNSSTTNTTSCDANENTDGDHFFCTPTGGDLKAVLQASILQLITGTKLVQMYAQPIVTGVSPSTNGLPGGGTPVTITGKYFNDAYAVTFGGTTVSFTVDSDTQISARAPAGAALSTVDVQVSSPGGSSKIVPADRFTYGP
jgi:hypothetical protein